MFAGKMHYAVLQNYRGRSFVIAQFMMRYDAEQFVASLNEEAEDKRQKQEYAGYESELPPATYSVMQLDSAGAEAAEQLLPMRPPERSASNDRQADQQAAARAGHACKDRQAVHR